MVIREEFSYSSVGISSGIGYQDHVGTTFLDQFGTQEQIDRWLKPALAGDFVIALAITEPDAGSDVRSIRTRARRTDDGWVISGRKLFITNSPLADAIAVVARIDDREDRFGVFMVMKEDGRYTCERTLAKLGCRSSEVGELAFDDFVIPADRMVIPPEGSPAPDIFDVLVRGRALIAASAVGIVRRAFDLGIEYAKHRRAFGRPISRFQEISMKLAEASMRLQAASLLTYHSGALIETQPTAPELECSQAKLFTAETAVWIVDNMMRIFGGAGYMVDSEMERLYRDVRFFTIVEGTEEIQHRIISSQLGL